jgi:hypothetical protein
MDFINILEAHGGADAMLKAASPQKARKAYPPEVMELLRKGLEGDETVLPELDKLFAQDPGLESLYRDVAKEIEQERAVAETSKPATPKGDFIVDLRAVIEKTTQGDMAALPILQGILDEHPEFIAKLGDMVHHAEQALLTLASGSNLTMRESVHRCLVELRARLAATATSELEKLLVDRIALCWLETYHCDIRAAEYLMNKKEGSRVNEAAQKRLDRAHQRFVTAIKTLATVQKLLRPSPSPFDLLSRNVAETDLRSRARNERLPADGVPVMN